MLRWMLLIALAACGGDKDDDSGDTGTAGTTPSGATESDTDTDTDADTDTDSDTDADTDTDTDTDTDVDTSMLPATCPDLRPNYVDCEGHYSYHYGIPEAPGGVGVLYYDGDGDPTVTEDDWDADGVVDTYISQTFDDDGRLLEYISRLNGYDDPWTHIRYTYRPDGQPLTRHTLANGSPMDVLETYVYGPDQRLSSYESDNENDGVPDWVCDITWTDGSTTDTARWECPSYVAEHVFHKATGLGLKSSYDYGLDGVFERVHTNVFDAECKVIAQSARYDQSQNPYDQHDEVDTVRSYDASSRWIGSATTMLDLDGVLDDGASRYQVDYTCP